MKIATAKTVAIAAIMCLTGGVSDAKDADLVAAAITPPSPNASEDYPIDYPGGPAPAAVAGALDGDDSTYNRLTPACGPLSGVGSAVFYDTITLTNTGSGDATVNVDMDCGGGNGFLTAYSGAFNPAAPSDNCLASNDDSMDACPVLAGLVLGSGETVVLVVSSFANGTLFDWTADFTGTVPVELQSFQVE